MFCVPERSRANERTLPETAVCGLPSSNDHRPLHWAASILLCLIALVTPASLALSAQTPVPAVRVVGVFDGATGAPLPGVQIVDLLTGSYTTTLANGAAAIGFVSFRGSAGLIELRKIGYTPQQIAITSADTTPITALLDRFVELPASVTTEAYRVDLDAGQRGGFERPCAVANASCLRVADMARRPASSVGDILGDTKGMLVGLCGAANSSMVSQSRPRGCRLLMEGPFGACQPRLLVNGFSWDQKVLGPPIDPPDVPPGYAPYGPGDVAGIEIYAPDRPVPARFGRQPGCGVVVIWTK